MFEVSDDGEADDRPGARRAGRHGSTTTEVDDGFGAVRARTQGGAPLVAVLLAHVKEVELRRASRWRRARRMTDLDPGRHGSKTTKGRTGLELCRHDPGGGRRLFLLLLLLCSPPPCACYTRPLLRPLACLALVVIILVLALGLPALACTVTVALIMCSCLLPVLSC